MFFCQKCRNFSPTDRCQYCGAKKLREAQENDPVYLTTKNFTYSCMLEQALKQNDIPFIKREKQGGILKYVGFGLGSEEFDFYVPLGAYEESKELLAELFGHCKLRPAKNPGLFKQGIRRIKK